MGTIIVEPGVNFSISIQSVQLTPAPGGLNWGYYDYVNSISPLEVNIACLEFGSCRNTDSSLRRCG